MGNMDKHWKEVMDLAEKYGFIIQAYGGVATLATHKVQKEEFGEEKYKRIQKMNGREAKKVNEEYRQALENLETKRIMYSHASKGFEAAAYYEMKAAEERVIAIIKEIKQQKLNESEGKKENINRYNLIEKLKQLIRGGFKCRHAQYVKKL